MARGTGLGTVTKTCKCSAKRTCPHGWTARWWENGRQHVKTFKDTTDAQGKRQYGSGKKLAEDFLSERYKAKRAGDETFTDRRNGDIPFLEYAEQWIAARPNKGTAANYRLALRHASKALEGKTLRQVANDREGAQALIDAAPGTYRARTRVVLVSPCNEALKEGRLGSHRLRGLRVEEESQRAEFTFATHEQLETMAAELGDLGLLVWTGRLAGLRIGESLGLNIADFREDGTVIRLQRQRMADGSLSQMKARKADDFRDIPCPAALWERVRNAPTYEDGSLFPRQWRTAVMDQFRKARDIAGLPSEFVPHWLRHMYASVLLANGVPITDVARFLGHKDVKITFAIYGHLAPSSLGRARDVIDADWKA